MGTSSHQKATRSILSLLKEDSTIFIIDPVHFEYLFSWLIYPRADFFRAPSKFDYFDLGPYLDALEEQVATDGELDTRLIESFGSVWIPVVSQDYKRVANQQCTASESWQRYLRITYCDNYEELLLYVLDSDPAVRSRAQEQLKTFK